MPGVGESCSKGWAKTVVSLCPYGVDYRYVCPMELGYARVSTAKQDLDRQIDALRQVGIAAERIYVDKKSGTTIDRPGWLLSCPTPARVM